MEVLVFSTSWVYVEVWLLPLSSVPTQSRSFLDRAGVVGLDMGVLTLFASPRGMGVLTLPVSWTQLEVGLMACTSSSPQGRELLFFPGVARNKRLETLLFLEGEHPPRVYRWSQYFHFMGWQLWPSPHSPQTVQSPGGARAVLNPSDFKLTLKDFFLRLMYWFVFVDTCCQPNKEIQLNSVLNICFLWTASRITIFQREKHPNNILL